MAEEYLKQMRLQQNRKNKTVNRSVKVGGVIDIIPSATGHILAIGQIKHTK